MTIWREKMAEDQLLLRAEIFRSKLIENFQFLDAVTDKGSEEVPKYFSDEIKSTMGMNSMMRTCPNALVRFQVYNQRECPAYTDKRLNRIKTKSRIPVGPWAKMVVENSRVQNFMLILIISNSIVLGIQAEIPELNSSPYKEIKLFLNIFDYLALMIFIFEILLKWIDGFFGFWKNGWNVFDFLVTVMSFVPELIKAASPTNANESVKLIAENLRTFRVLRSLKMVSRFAQLRIIVMTMLKALKSMVFVLILLATFMYIFAVTGTVMFTGHHKSTNSDIKYRYIFSNLGNSLVTLFQLFTLDRWFEILIDIGKTYSGFFSKVYIILWICVGAFIFRNVFTGIMVMNFQDIRNEFVMHCKEQEQALIETQNREKLEEELTKQYQTRKISVRRKAEVAAKSSSKDWSLSASLLEAQNDSTTGGMAANNHSQGFTYTPSCPSSDFDTINGPGSSVTSPHNYVHHKGPVHSDNSQETSDKRQVTVTKSSSDPSWFSPGDRIYSVSQSTSIQTSSQGTVLSKEALPSFNTCWLSDGSTFSATGSSVGNLGLKGLSPSTEFRPIEERNLIADQSVSGYQEKDLDRKSIAECKSDTTPTSYPVQMSVTAQLPNEAQISESDRISDVDQMSDVIQKSDEDQMSDARRLPAVCHLRILDGANANQRILTKGVTVDSCHRSFSESSESSISSIRLAKQPIRVLHEDQMSDVDQISDQSRKDTPVRSSGTSRLLIKSQNSDMPLVYDGNAIGERFRGEALTQPTSAADESNTEEMDLLDISKCDRNDEQSNANNKNKDYNASTSWNNAVMANLATLKDSTNETLWPRDVLFRYFQLMETLQDNLAERCQLQKLAVVALNQMHDGSLK